MAAEPNPQLEAFLVKIDAMPIDDMVKLYVQTRETSAAATRVYDQQKDQFKAIMERIEVRLLDKATEQGTTGFKTEAGTTFIAETAKISVADSSAFTTFLDNLPAGTDRYGFFEQRVSSKRVEEYTKSTGTPPPGLNVFREKVMRVRKASDR